jgi:hypothetical protein
MKALRHWFDQSDWNGFGHSGIFHRLARQKECQILEGHLMPDYVHLCIGIPPRHPVASVIGFLKGGVRLRTPGCAARSGTSRASISGPAGMSLRRSGSNWSGSANTSASKRSRMATVDISRRLTKTRFSATTKLMANRLGGGQLLSYPLRGADCPSCGALVQADYFERHIGGIGHRSWVCPTSAPLETGPTCEKFRACIITRSQISALRMELDHAEHEVLAKTLRYSARCNPVGDPSPIASRRKDACRLDHFLCPPASCCRGLSRRRLRPMVLDEHSDGDRF